MVVVEDQAAVSRLAGARVLLHAPTISPNAHSRPPPVCRLPGNLSTTWQRCADEARLRATVGADFGRVDT